MWREFGLERVESWAFWVTGWDEVAGYPRPFDTGDDQVVWFRSSVTANTANPSTKEFRVRVH